MGETQPTEIFVERLRGRNRHDNLAARRADQELPAIRSARRVLFGGFDVATVAYKCASTG
jgi:hypothetical protein